MRRLLPTLALAAGLGLCLCLAGPAPQAWAAAGFTDNSGTDTTAPGTTYTLTAKTGDAAVQPLIGRLANLLVGLTGSIALLIFVWAGITMITAEGDPKKIETAKKMMVWTVVGLLVIFASEALVRFVLGALLTGTAS